MEFIFKKNLYRGNFSSDNPGLRNPIVRSMVILEIISNLFLSLIISS